MKLKNAAETAANHRKFRLFKLCALIMVAACLFSACAAGGEQKHFTAFKNTDVTVQVRGKTLSISVEENIRAFLKDLNAEFSATVSGSTTYKINSAATGEETEISERFKTVANECREIYDFTDGKFDPSVYPLTLLWQFAPDYPVPHFTLPTGEEITETLKVVGYGKFSFDGAAVKTADKAKLDFGGALKGYAADKIAEILKKDGVTKGYVNVGGSSLYLISVDNLAVSHPRGNGNILTVKIKEKGLSVSTSGDYEKTYTLNGKTYSHILDPVSGYPSKSGVISATIIGKNGLKLDALTTAACVCSHDSDAPENGELYKFLVKILKSEDFNGAQIFAVCLKDGKKQILTNKKQGEDFTLHDKSYEIVYITS